MGEGDGNPDAAGIKLWCHQWTRTSEQEAEDKRILERQRQQQVETQNNE